MSLLRTPLLLPLWRLIGIALLTTGSSCAARAASAAAPVDFSREILPILSNKCFVCHGPDNADEDQLRLDSFEAAASDRGGYRAIDPEDPGKSEILARIRSADQPMPPAEAEKQLTDAERELLSRWILQGGTYARHWAFVRPQRHTVSQERGSAASAIDGFLEDQLSEHGIAFAAEADRATLARRAALVLTGLPPEPEQLAAFLENDRDEAYERLVDELLSSQRFGEHQARFWLDAVRYGDTHGLHLDNRRGIYAYRDWVVRALNENLPWDEFITWQLAGDLLADPTLAQRVATGYVRLNPSTGEGGAIPEEFQIKNNFDRVETLGTVFLGMTFACARCHNHKFDPVSQLEYYQLLAYFNSTAEPALDGNSYEYGPVAKVPADQSAWEGWNALTAERDQLLERARSSVRELASAAALSTWDQADSAERLKLLSDPEGAYAGLQLQRTAGDLLERMTKAEAEFTPTLVAEELSTPRETFLLRRGEYDLPQGEPLEPGVPAVMGTLPPDAPANRLGLARWLTSPEHPLVARVLVNRIWQNVFGYGLVRTPEDFGLQGQQPTHPELLDWLAVEFQDSGWDFKHMVRLMVTTRAFRQSSAWREDLDDPTNRLLARGPGFRLDAEVIRDIGLWSSGLFNPRVGGEGVKPYQPPGMWEALAHPASNTREYVRDEGERLYRRSLYVYWKRTSPHPMMTLFDAPDRESSCVRRSRTNTPLQSLALFNETQRVEIARKLAERLMTRADQTGGRLHLLFTLLAARPPTDAETKACIALLKTMQDRYASNQDDAIALLSTGDAPRETALDAVDLAAWTQVCATVLASDPAILLY